MASERLDPWAVLGVAPGADQDELRAAHRAAVRRHHPDANPGDAAAVAEMRRVNAAWAALQDAPPPPPASAFEDARPVVASFQPRARPGLLALVLGIIALLILGTAYAGDPRRNQRPGATADAVVSTTP